MLYHQTKGPYYVKQFLGHKTLKNTEIYINIERTIFGEYGDEFTVNVASKQEEIKALLETGLEYVCEKDGPLYFRSVGKMSQDLPICCRGSLAWNGRQTHNLENKMGQSAQMSRGRGLESRPRHHLYTFG